MDSSISPDEVFSDLFNELITQQNEKVLRCARERLPHLTAEDILNSHDFPELRNDPIFNYEEGIATGLMTAEMALRARCADLKRKENSYGKNQ